MAAPTFIKPFPFRKYPMLLAFVGPPALSFLRRRSLLARCQSCAPEIEDLCATYFYAVQCARALTDDELAQLMRILDVDAALPARARNEVAIGPRPGTTSPWSSKATDILRNCGLEFVRRVERGTLYAFAADTLPSAVLPLLYDRMIEAPLDSLETLFRRVDPKPLVHIPVRAEGRRALVAANREMGLALSDEEIDYALHAFAGRDPTDVELMMFAVVNSEHCRHKIFNADWIIDGQREARSLFDMIRHTHAAHPQGTVKAYSDNAGVIEGFAVPVFGPQLDQGLALWIPPAANPRLDQGRDPQPPHCHCALSRSVHWGGGRDPRRGGSRHRRLVAGGPVRLFHLASAPAWVCPAVGKRARGLPRPLGYSARHYDRRADRRRGLWQ